MRAPFILFILCIFLQFSFEASAQLDPQHDTLSMANANRGRMSYANNIRGGGNPNVTERIDMPVAKLKEIVDACAAAGLTNISFMIIKVRAEDLAHFQYHNPNAPTAQLIQSQMLVIRVPRSIFKGAAAASVFKGTPLMLSLASAGLIQLAEKQNPFGIGDYYYSFGTICPPPASCDTN